MGIYFSRLHADDFFLSGGLVFGCLLTPIILPIACFLLFHIWATLRYWFKHHDPIPAIVLLGGSLLAMCIPIGPTFEEELFLSFRTEYEQLVELSLTGQLEHDD
ncbi:MAG: hypothetical protein GY832_15950, partial [Chloroflexi bacterium]|nr:hypothetical protein [Chloroflexota bacterium]